MSTQDKSLLLSLLNTPGITNVPVQNATSGELNLQASGPSLMDEVTLILQPSAIRNLLEFAPAAWWLESATLSDAIINGWLSVITPADAPTAAAPIIEDSPLIPPQDPTDGDLLVALGGKWVALSAGSNGDVLTSNGAATIPSYQAGGGAGGVEVEDEGVSLGSVAKINFIGAGVTAAIDGGDPTQANVTVSGGGGSSLDAITLGTPTDGSFADGLLPFQTTDLGVDAIDQINEVLAAIAPTAPGDITGLALVLSGTTQFSAKLPTGLGAEWGAYTPGATITNLIYDNTFFLATPNPTTRLGDGLVADTEGVLTAVVDGADSSVRNISAGVGVTGVMEITDVESLIYRKVNARLTVTQVEGEATYAIRHDPDGGPASTSSTTALIYDSVSAAPTFAGGPIAILTVTTSLTRFLSGREYLREGAVVELGFTANGCFSSGYHPTAVATGAFPSASDVSVNPLVIPAVGAQFKNTPAELTLVASNVNDNDPTGTVTARKPNGNSAVASASAGLVLGVNTWSAGGSSATLERFVDESERLNLGLLTAWNSTLPLASNSLEAHNGFLEHGFDGTYEFDGGHGAGTTESYERLMGNSVFSGATLRLTGVTAAQIDAATTGALNILVHLETDALWFDLGLDFGLNNGTGSGDSVANSIGARISSVGSDLVFSLGVNSTGTNNNELRVQVTYITATGLAITQMELV